MPQFTTLARAGSALRRSPPRSSAVWRPSLACVVTALTLALVEPADATTILASSIEELAVASGAVVQGRVTRVEGKLRDRHVVSVVTIEVDEVLLGSSPARIQLESPSGTIGDLRTRVAGADLYSVGDEVILFAEQSPNGIWRSMALAWGCFKIHDGIAVRSTEGIDFVQMNDKGQVRGVTLTPEEVAMTVEELRARIEAAGDAP